MALFDLYIKISESQIPKLLIKLIIEFEQPDEVSKMYIVMGRQIV